MALRKLLEKKTSLFILKKIICLGSTPPYSKTQTIYISDLPHHLKFYSSTCKKDNDKKNKENEIYFRHGFSDELEGGINNQILLELDASMVYLSMFCYYGRTDIALPGCQSFFKAMYNEEQSHALEFIEYQLMRGGQVKLFPVTVPEDMNWTDITVAFGVALELEKRVKEKLEELAKLAETHNDLQLADFIVANYLAEQNKSICEMGRLLTKAKRLVDTGGVGRHMFDKEVFVYVQNTKKPEIKLPYENI